MFQKYFVVPVLSLFLAIAKKPFSFFHLVEAIQDRNYPYIAYHGCRCAIYWWQQVQPVNAWIAERNVLAKKRKDTKPDEDTNR
jgi:hypothetical protein